MGPLLYHSKIGFFVIKERNKERMQAQEEEATSPNDSLTKAE
jgi:hypothetical protein